MKTVLMLIAVFVVLVQAEAKTWTVGGGGNFSQIQMAIDAASDGDVIIVRPGSYLPFKLDKGVVITATSNFTIDHTRFIPNAPVVIRSTTREQKTGISGMTIIGGWDVVPLRIENCQGEVILENIHIESPATPQSRFKPEWPTDTHLRISSCANVAVTSLLISPFLVTFSGRSYRHPGHNGAVFVESSSVRFSDCTINGGNGEIWDSGFFSGPGVPGGHGIDARDSFVVLARSNVAGGSGSDGLALNDLYPEPHGGDGGHGYFGTASELVVLGLGDATDQLTGGRGGDGVYVLLLGWISDGGDGGDGLRGDGLVSRVRALGRRGGVGRQNGRNGRGFCGNLSFDSRLPFTEMTGNVKPGGFLQIDMQGSEPGAALLLLSGQGGFLDLPSAIGPPLSAVPGEWLFFFNIGRNDGLNPLTFKFDLINHPIIQGLSFNAQSFVLSDQGELLVGNSVTRIGLE